MAASGNKVAEDGQETQLTTLFMKKEFITGIAFAAAFMAPANSIAGLINGGFEEPNFPSPNSVYYPVSIPGWTTTDVSFEIWTTAFNSVPAYEGDQFAELNAYNFGTLSQNVSGIGAGQRVGFQFAHRGRAGLDTMRFTLTDLGLNNVVGGGDDTLLFTKTYTDGTQAWGFYDASGEAPIYALGNTVRFAYEAVTAAGSQSIGNFLDAADFGVGVGGVPAPDGGSTLALFAVGIAGVAGFARRRS